MPYTAPALKYFHDEAALALESIYRDDATPEGEAFRDRLIFTINTYCQDHANAGAQIASFVEDIPFPEEISVEDALLARHVLLETQAALKSLLDDDAEFLESYRGDTVPDEGTDASVRADASEFDKRYKIDKEAVIRQSAQEGSATDSEVTDSFYDGKNSEKVESDVAHSSRDRGFPEQQKPKSEIPDAASPSASDPSTPLKPALQQSEKKPKNTRPTIQAPDYLGGSPSLVFNQAKQWLVDHIIKIASGTTKDGEFPRIAPLAEIPENLPYHITAAELTAIVTDIRTSVRRIKPPLVESFDGLRELGEKLRRLGPKGGGDIGSAIDAFNDAMGAFRDAFDDPDEDKYDLGTNDWKQKGDADGDD